MWKYIMCCLMIAGCNSITHTQITKQTETCKKAGGTPELAKRAMDGVPFKVWCRFNTEVGEYVVSATELEVEP